MVAQLFALSNQGDQAPQAALKLTPAVADELCDLAAKIEARYSAELQVEKTAVVDSTPAPASAKNIPRVFGSFSPHAIAAAGGGEFTSSWATSKPQLPFPPDAERDTFLAALTGDSAAREAMALLKQARQTESQAKLAASTNVGSAQEGTGSGGNSAQVEDKGGGSKFLEEWAGEMLAVTAVVVGRNKNAAFSRIAAIARLKQPIAQKLPLMEKTGLLRPDVSASELANLLKVTPAAVKKTRWWKSRMVQRRSDDAEAKAPYLRRHRRGRRR